MSKPYRVAQSNNVTAFDCDNTILMWKPLAASKKNYPIRLVYGDKIHYFKANIRHVDFLKHCFNRGDYVVLWSKNGHAWCELAAKALGIENYIHLIMSKPSRHIDDKKDIASIIGDHIYLGDDL